MNINNHCWTVATAIDDNEVCFYGGPEGQVFLLSGLCGKGNTSHVRFLAKTNTPWRIIYVHVCVNV